MYLRAIPFTLLIVILLLPPVMASDDGEKKPGLPLEGKTETLAFTTDEGSWLSIDVMPDGESLVFDLLGDLYTLPISGGRTTRITSGLGFDSQPAVSPDGRWIAFVSDRSGSDNLWVARTDGSEPRKISDEKHWGIISPAWTPDSQYIIVTRTAEKPELTMYHVEGGTGVTLAGATEEDKPWGVGVVVSPQGSHAYFAKGEDSKGPVDNFPATQISRYDFSTGEIDQLTQSEGGAFRPELSPDGNLLVYGTRNEARTGFRIRNLRTGSDRWLTYPAQRDAQENFRPPSRDVMPGYSFMPDGESIVFNSDGRIWRVDVATGERLEIPFTVEVALDIGPDLTAPYRVPQGDLTATLIHDPRLAPDGKKIAASVLTKIYVLDTADGRPPRPLTATAAWEFKPVWSPDGRWIAYVTWSAEEGGHIWRTRSNGSGRPQRLTDIAAFYTDLVYSPDGETLFAMRGSEYLRHQTFSEFGGLRVALELVSLPADGGSLTVIRSAHGSRYPHFGPGGERIFLTDESGLFSVQLDGTDRREELVVTAPRGNRRGEEPPQAESIRISPDGKYALAHVGKQVWALAVARAGGKAPTVDIRGASLPVAQLTDIGADFYGWTADGRSIWWAIGNTFYTRPFASVVFRDEKPQSDDDADADDEKTTFVPKDENESVSSYPFRVVVSRSTPSGSMLLRGANLISMSGETTAEMDRVQADQDILVTNNRIAAIGARGSLDVPADTQVIDVAGKYVVPGFIDTHAHWEMRTDDVLEPHNWTLAANLAYGVTAGLDVQTSSHDYLAYRDFVETGQSVGQRAFMTARGIFGDTDFQSYDATLAYLRRYSDHYRTRNIKSYVVGNRKQRQWIVLAAKELGLMPTTEGAGDQRLDITHAIDGMHGNEHTLPDSPLYRDIVELYARTRTAYTPTLIVQYNAEAMEEYFFTRTEVHDDPKLRRFYPHNRLDELTQRRPRWQRDDEFDFRQAAAQAAKIQRAGGLVGIGGHGEVQGLGYHWEMQGFAMGGMRPVEVLRAATIDGARIIGVNQDLGSVEVGKLADMVILDASPLEDIRHTLDIDRVVQNGRLYDGETLDQIWPESKALAPFWWWDDNDVRFSTSPVAQ
jgi:Tol biopolymer transport system component